MLQQKPNRLKPFFENIHVDGSDNQMTVNFGPQHPSSHGQIRIVLDLEGEKITGVDINIGYMHRGMEKMAENMMYNEFVPTTDRLEYIASTVSNYAFVRSVENLLDIEVPRRASVIRVMLMELTRVVSHIFWLATFALEIGAMSVFLFAFRVREYGLDLFEEYCGARLTHSSICIGGVPLDIPDGWTDKLLTFCDRAAKQVKMLEELLTTNRIWRMRLENVGNLSAENARNWGTSGVVLRGSGVQYDIRKEEPYEIYDEFEFDIPYTDRGDSYGRYLIRMAEIGESIKIIKQAIIKYKDTPKDVRADLPGVTEPIKENVMTQNYSLMQHFVLIGQGIKPPVGESYFPVETPRGEMGYFINSQGDSYPYRVKIKTPSFSHCAILEELLVGNYIADITAIMGCTDIIICETDR